ncbi:MULTISPECIES: sigma-70 family RNA polymerase sigma factor [Micrococcaceae]|uniref:sigma-70 family RNA polymerase sigma factor n=1 Tax=unclassified Kocuria TaxID=2649579 RepID=UPI001EDCC7B5|nr:MULTISPECIES: sigma-70 family RNA polymerase sigma factor [unclassified Kocuria]
MITQRKTASGKLGGFEPGLQAGGMTMVIMARSFRATDEEPRDPEVAEAVRASESEHDLLEALMGCASRGNQNCFERLYDLLVPRIYGLVQRILRNRSHAEEVTQEVFLEVWQKAPQYDPSRGAVGSWVTVIAHRRAVDRVRATQSAWDREMRTGKTEFRETYEHVESTVQQSLESESVHAALSRVPQTQVEVMTLAYFGGLSQSKIATMLEIPLGTVKTRMRQGLKRLRSELGGEYEAS